LSSAPSLGVNDLNNPQEIQFFPSELNRIFRTSDGLFVRATQKTSARRKWLAITLLSGVVVQVAQTHPQQPTQIPPITLVTWYGLGGIALPNGQAWKLELLTAYDKDRRPVAQFSNSGSRINVSFILFENLSGKPDMQGCRTDAIEPILQNAGSSISKRVYGESTTKTGQSLATASYSVDMSVAGVPQQRNLFGFAGNAKTCAELHISSFGDDPTVQDAMKAALASFQPDLDYQPSAVDYFRVASLLFRNAPALAAPYYKSSLDAMPSDAQFLTPRRVATDQLVMALGMSGDIKSSRAVAEKAIAADPDYPINYYNLACADAENGNASDAKLHLQQAFDRRANVLKGEQMPDPTKDDSILKLKKNKEFWTFVVGLAQH